MNKVQEFDWGYHVNGLMAAARRSVSEVPDPMPLLKAKLAAAEVGHKTKGVEGIRIVRDSRDEARAIIAAMIEKSMAEMAPAAVPIAILETLLEAEVLRDTMASEDPFVHQLKLATMCETLTSAVVLLLCLQLKSGASKDPAQ